MKLVTVLWLLAFGFHASKSSETDDDIDFYFDLLEEKLKEHQNIANKLTDEIIKEVSILFCQ